ncbi:hypothetical protein [Romboutsia sp.]|uniref:hypothetical protein n=1 Tax=Romboutsia sp. TaxID=1965302 RepID=UPI002CD5D202|nr:hypothetical protein [Romboutsia sp.]HSQ89370.1 hypothetical protein [Romboutsia sp.]
MKNLKTLVMGILVGANILVGGYVVNNMNHMYDRIAELENINSEQFTKKEEPIVTTLPVDYKAPIERYTEVELSPIVKDAIKTSEESEDKKIYILQDDSSIVVNEKENMYLFYPACMGDWNYTLDNLGQLNMAIETYLDSISYN